MKTINIEMDKKQFIILQMTNHKVLSFTLSLLLLFNLSFAQDGGASEKLKSHVEILSSDSLEGRGVGTHGKEIARDYIIGQFKEIGLKPFGTTYLHPFEFRKDLVRATAENIAGYLEGSDSVLKDEFIVIGAHYDHLGYEKKGEKKIIYPGADDNASGVASIIEIAGYFSKNPSFLGRSLIVVAFDAEESGLLGSYDFVYHCPVDLSKIKLMFSFDMVGMYEANGGLDLRGLGTLEEGNETASALAQDHDLIIKNKGSSIPMGTDTYPFGSKGIPSVHVFTSTKSPYHKPLDKYDLLDYNGMELVFDFSLALISKLSKAEQLTPSPDLTTSAVQKQKTKQPKFSFGVLMNNGSGFHKYKNEFYRAKSVYNFNAGVFTRVPINSLIRIEPSLLYDFNGSKIDGGTFRRHSITVPLNVQFVTPDSFSNQVRLFAFGGAYFRYNLAGSSAGETLDFSNDAEQTEWGYSFGVGVEIFQFQVGFTNRHGLTNIYQSDNQVVLDNSNYLTLGYRF